MAENLEGTISFNKKGQRFLDFTTAKGGKINLVPSPDILSPQIKESKEEKISVKVDTGSDGRPNKVYMDGESFTPQSQIQRNSNLQNQRQGDQNQRNVQNPPRNNFVQSLKSAFHNPYNFVPAIPRNHIDGKIDELGDREPSGHDRYFSDKFSGKLTVKMKVETPLIVLDTARMIYTNDKDRNIKEHKSFPVRIENSKPFINPTAVKGMLRSAYEAVTNSRMSVFGKKQTERLAFRAEVGEGLFVVPARIDDEKVFLYTGTSGQPTISGKPQNGQPMYAAWVRKYKWHGNYSNAKLNVSHKQKVWAYINLWEKRRKFTFWNVVEIQPHSATPPPHTPSENRVSQIPGTNKFWRDASSLNKPGKWVEGYYCRTGENIKNKHDERIFFVPQSQNPIKAVVNDFEKLKKEWKRLIEDYQEEHSDGKGGLEKLPKDVPEWSRQIKGGNNETKLETGTLCYAKVQENGGKFEILELYPVMISRRLHEVSPESLLHPTLKPAKNIAQLSPADRVFGWVGDGVKKNGNYRGQIRIGVIKTDKTDTMQEFDDLPLNILGQPKPQQGRFYVAKDNKGNAQERSSDLTNEKAGYKNDKGLRGRKVYPHHTGLPEDYWFEKTLPNFQNNSEDYTQNPVGTSGNKFREYLRPKGLNENSRQIEQQRDSQNRSIKGWIKPGTEFEFDIHFANLSEAELGALVWLLQLPKRHFHRFGGGKPLGFGSVQLNLKKSEITSGEHLKEFYNSLDASLTQSKTPENCKAEFEKSANQEILEAFKTACKGFSTSLPIHYPRARHYEEIKRRNEHGNGWHTDRVEYINPKNIPLPPHQDGLSYEWFVENSKDKVQPFGEEMISSRYALKDITDDDGLPIMPHKSGERRED
ncbi:MAG TPA: TIGR03986 family CRISPR-associated RAMP protein [Pyrinomonadaceae bacterium]|jgi:CRISPR-associated protein (TIGR03986 family)